MSLREIKIKTGVLKRTHKELAAYKKELIQQQERVDKLIAENKDIHDIRKQKEVLEETIAMIPDTERRLQAAHSELASLLAEIQSSNDSTQLESEEVVGAQALIQELGLA